MAITVGVNSWATIAQADFYLTDRIGSAEWFALDNIAKPGDDSREAALVSAYYWLLDDLYLGLSPSTTPPAELIRAQAETALFILKFKLDYDQREASIASGTTSISQLGLSETFAVMSKPQTVLNILKKLGVGGADLLVELNP